MTETAELSTEAARTDVRRDTLRAVVASLILQLQDGAGDRDKRRQVEEWMKSLSEKYPEFEIQRGLRDYYLSEATRLKKDFDTATDLTEKLNLGRAVETFLDRAADCTEALTRK